MSQTQTKTMEIEITLAIRKALESKSLDATSAISIIRKGMELLNTYPQLKGSEKKAMLVRVLEQVSAGNDGVLGTDDDLLPEATLNAMKILLEGGGDLLGDIVNTLSALMKGGVNAVDKEVALSIVVRLKAIFQGLMGCFKKNGAGVDAGIKLPVDALPLPEMKTNPLAAAAAAAAAAATDPADGIFKNIPLPPPVPAGEK